MHHSDEEAVIGSKIFVCLMKLGQFVEIDPHLIEVSFRSSIPCHRKRNATVCLVKQGTVVSVPVFFTELAKMIFGTSVIVPQLNCAVPSLKKMDTIQT